MKQDILDYLESNVETLRRMVSDCNSWNGSLDYLDYYENDEYFFNDFFRNPDDAVRAVCYGDYEYMDDYVRFNAYGNLESCSEFEYEKELKDSVEDIFDTWYELYQERNVNIDYLDDSKFKMLIWDYEKEEDE